MTLPEGFRWARRWQYSTCDDALTLDGEQVALLLDRVDGGWFARLECQKGGVSEPLVTRRCSSYEAGKRGCELWAARHEARLRREVAEKIAARPVHNGAGGWSRPGEK
ncbi:hypothetical protein [Pseudoxanthomonas winnipegensis]|uniref:Uncharacterized protein n=1 Tax=Pseudoxanthomonas winnipegensis TaxID=2480810 RepID=A0A4Q8LXT5_9GAMM|nr:hypothetical protein [Pseudoxanthomonas winnipegensis]RZZ90582.1 hypothetical protein EA663_02170 [Pseudoxanthomonas winnipegensis]TAA37262.1 hypothetical protein EA656_00870 [Pseudoxanthomonas winnipegensis]